MRPIGDELVQDADEERLHATWRGVRTRMKRRRWAPARRAAIGAIALGAATAFVGWMASAPPTGPIHHASGAALHAAESVAEPRTLQLEDRSTIELGTGARLEPRRNDADRLELALVRGRARFDVTPGGPREWVIDAGLATIRVLGTAFVIDRGEATLVVEVERGRVRVESETLVGGPRELTGGQRIELQRPEPPPEPAESESAVESPIAASGVVPPDEENVAAPEPEQPAPSPARAATATQEESNIEASPSELLRRADLARRAGRASDAREPLEAILRDHPDHPEAPLAAITLARLQQGALGDPAGALQSLRLARRLGVPRLFDAEVCSSMALVLAEMGSAEEAGREARECLARHGSPPESARLRQLADSP